MNNLTVVIISLTLLVLVLGTAYYVYHNSGTRAAMKKCQYKFDDIHAKYKDLLNK